MISKISLPWRLGLLVAGTALPLIVFAAAIVYQHHIERREEAFNRVLQLVRSTRLVLDSETQRVTAGLQVLGQSNAVQRGDFEAFRNNSRAFLSQYPDKATIVVGDREGRVLFNSDIASGEPLPEPAARPDRDEVFRTRRPAYSNLFIGPTSKAPIITVTVPVFRNNEVVYDISFNPPLESFQRIIERQRPGPDWTFSFFDRNGVSFARMPNPESTLGHRASPSLLAELFKSDEAKLPTISLEGVSLLTVFTRSDITGWAVAAGIAEETLTAPLVRRLAVTTIVGLGLLLLSLAFALRLATRLARAESIQSLLVAELNHRIRNVLTIVQSLAAQTFRTTQSLPDAGRKFNARLLALSRANNLLSEDNWQNAAMDDIIASVLEPFSVGERKRVHVSGPNAQLAPNCAMMMSMMLHELATNAAKYGALSNESGEVLIEWREIGGVKGRRLHLTWEERNGPRVLESDRTGFGTTLIRNGLSDQLGGSAKIEFPPEGLRCELDCPTG